MVQLQQRDNRHLSLSLARYVDVLRPLKIIELFQRKVLVNLEYSRFYASYQVCMRGEPVRVLMLRFPSWLLSGLAEINIRRVACVFFPVVIQQAVPSIKVTCLL